MSAATAAPARASLRAAIGMGFSIGVDRLRRRGPLLIALLTVALAAVEGAVERRVARAFAVDRALEGAFGLLVPLATFALIGALTGPRRLSDACWPAARYGLARREVALGLTAAGIASAALLGLVVAVVTVAFAYAPGTAGPGLARDAFTTGWIGALAGASYAAWFALGATFGGRGGGRAVPLAMDFFFGGSTGVLGAILPRGNVKSLVGGAAPLGLAQPASAAILVLAAIVLTFAAAARCKE